MNSYAAYEALLLPAWAPPAWLFAPVWTLLYAVILVTFGTVFYRAAAGGLPRAVALPFALNLVFNLSYTWLQFGLENYTLASLDVLLVLATLAWAMRAISPHARWVALANIPYLLWVAFATALQLTVTFLNT